MTFQAKRFAKTLCKRFRNLSANRMWAGPTSLPHNLLVCVHMCQQWRRLSLRSEVWQMMWRAIVWKTQMQLIRVRASGDRIDGLSLLVRLDASASVSDVAKSFAKHFAKHWNVSWIWHLCLQHNCSPPSSAKLQSVATISSPPLLTDRNINKEIMRKSRPDAIRW